MLVLNSDSADLSLETPEPAHAPDQRADPLKALDFAIERGRQALLAEQRDDGSWEDRTDLGLVGAAMYWIVERQFDVLSADDAKDACRYLLSQQRLLGLLAGAEGERQTIDKAARYLIENQDADGLWRNAGWLHTVNPPDSFYSYDLPAKALPLLALCRYRELVRPSPATA